VAVQAQLTQETEAVLVHFLVLVQQVVLVL
jgi:hypothetical protein